MATVQPTLPQSAVAPSTFQSRRLRLHSRPHTSRSTQQATTALARSVPTSTTRTALIASRHRRHTYSSTATHLHLLSPRESLVPASHATFSVARRIHGPRWYHEWCGPEEDGDCGQERTGAAAILRVACSVQSCAVSCSCAPSTFSSWQVIEAGVKVGENKAPAVFADIQKGGANLKKTETNDKSAPVIEAGAKISPLV